MISLAILISFAVTHSITEVIFGAPSDSDYAVVMTFVVGLFGFWRNSFGMSAGMFAAYLGALFVQTFYSDAPFIFIMFWVGIVLDVVRLLPKPAFVPLIEP